MDPLQDPLVETSSGGTARFRRSFTMPSHGDKDNNTAGGDGPFSARALAGAALVASVLSLIVGIAALVVAARDRTCGATVALAGSEKVWGGRASFDAFTVNWEAENKAAWEAAVTDDIDMYVEGNAYSNNTGKEAVWRFRELLPNAPDGKLLWTNMYDSWHFDPDDPNTLHARMTTFLRAACTPAKYPGFCLEQAAAGSLYQLGRWTCKFDRTTGKVQYMHQDVVFALWRNNSM